MPKKPGRTKSYVAPQHPIRVVPLHRPETPSRAAPAAAPNLTYRNGPLLTAVQVFTVFWGSAWQQAPNSGLLQQINQFFDYILTSQLIDQLGEYSVPGQAIGHGSRIGTIVLTSPVLGKSVQDSAIQQLLDRRCHAARHQPQHSVLRISAPGRAGGARKYRLVPVLLRIPRFFRQKCLLRRDALSWLCGLHRRACGVRCPDNNDLARTVRGDHRSCSRPGLVRR